MKADRDPFFAENGLEGLECASVDRSYGTLVRYRFAWGMGLQLETNFDHIERCYEKPRTLTSAINMIDQSLLKAMYRDTSPATAPAMTTCCLVP